jgi:hypothetical protein
LFFRVVIYLVLFVTSSSYASSDFTLIKYKASKKTTLAKIISKFVKDDSIINNKTPMVQKILQDNSHIKNWRKIKKGTSLKIYISSDFIDIKKVEIFKKKQKMIANRKPKKKRRTKAKLKKYGISSQLGVVNIKGDDTLSMNLLKVGVSYKNQLNKNYRYKINLAGVMFTNIDSSLASESVSTDGLLPELGVGVSKNLSKKLSLGINYDMLNYFIVGQSSSTTITLSPKVVHRVSLKPYWSLSKSLGALSSLGYIVGEASGIDFSLGANYLFGKEKNYSLAVIAYMSQLKVEDVTEKSSAYVGSFGYGF